MGLVDIDIKKVKDWKDAPKGPVVMINLYRFKSSEEMVRFSEEISKIVGPILERVGAKIVYSGSIGADFIADEKWDVVALVRYPSYEAMLELFTDKKTSVNIVALRRAALLESRFMVSF